MSILSIIIGGLVALFVYAVGTAITEFENAAIIWGVIAVLIWIAIAVSDIDSRFNLRR